ncbi:Lipopolysaccharide export system protein LptA precursor [compost metagenome]
MTVTRDAQGNQQLQAQGSPVTFRQKVDGSNEYVEGSASNVNYNTAANLATLTGNARVKRGQDSVSGAVIVYNTATETYQASGGTAASGTSGRVTVILQPKAQGTP